MPKPPALPIPDDNDDDLSLEPLARLSRDIKNAAAMLSKQEVRYLVDTYYDVQRMRTASANQMRTLSQSGEPNELIRWTSIQMRRFEDTIKGALGVAAEADPAGAKILEIVGVGPVIAAGLLSHIDIEKAPTVSHIWRFAGLDPTTSWAPKTKRPWNAKLKTLVWKAGESFVKWQNHKDGVYGRLFVQRKTLEWQRNLRGGFAEQAGRMAKTFRENTESYPWYAGCYEVPDPGISELMMSVRTPARHADLLVEVEAGKGLAMLPPGHIHARAKRWAVKQFLVDVHRIMYLERYGKEPPIPYALEHLEGHQDFRVYGSDRYISVDEARGMLGLKRG